MRRRSAVGLIAGLGLGILVAVAAVAANRGAASGEPPVRDQAQLIGSFEWHSTGKKRKPRWFGGFSAIEISADGNSMLVLTDRSHLLTTRIRRDGDRIVGIDPSGPVVFLRTSRGKPMTKYVIDSEGLAITPDGDLFISFEGVSRVARYSAPTAPAQVLPRPRAFRRFPLNKGPEALAADSRGHLYTLPERSLNKDGEIPVWRWNGKTWSQPFALPVQGKFLPVGADFGPDGRFYVLERDFSILGFRSRLRRWTLRNGQPENEETLFRTGFGTHDNLEGVSIWRDGQNRLRATLVSDDNFLALQKTELVEYLLPD